MLANIAHRPWPLPVEPWAVRMTWHDLLLAHWPVPVAQMRALIPGALQIDTFDGTAWLGVVPFRMSGVTPRGIPALPWLSAFPELNVRTYVTAQDKPGVWFFSLDAANAVAVAVARAWYHLPYFRARMRCAGTASGGVAYESARWHAGAPAAELRAAYRPTGPAASAVRGALDYFLTERYCLYATDRRGRLFRADIHHRPWPLESAAAEFSVNTMTQSLGIALPATPPVLHFARELDVLAWPLAPTTP
jgi:uncharacterized protein YqjF (DUF2071 family)